jgi:endonuclease/exonuclease/phosphatase family metal-dependent hydrolase
MANATSLPHMRITSWNMLHGMEIPPNPAGPSSAALRSAIAQLDCEVIAVQEVDYNLPRSGGSNQIEEIAAANNAAHWAFAPSIIGTPGESWRKLKAGEDRIVSNKAPSDLAGSYGVAIASQIPVVSWHRLDLGNSPVGMPLIVPTESETSSKAKLRAIYVHDEPRLALGATLANGWTIFNTHLSFVPGVNLRQLSKLKNWAIQVAKETDTKPMILGDLNLPKNIPAVGGKWSSLISQNTYPSWGAKIQFDYILIPSEVKISSTDLGTAATGMSDHLPLRAEVN